MEFSMETPNQEKSRLAALEVKATPAEQLTLVDGVKSALPNLYPDHNTNPGSALLAATNDPNADPDKVAEITAAADEKYLVKTPVKPLDDGHVQAKQNFDQTEKDITTANESEKYLQRRENLSNSMDSKIDLKDIKKSILYILNDYAKDPKNYESSIFNNAFSISIADKLRDPKITEEEKKVAEKIKSFVGRSDLFSAFMNSEGSQEDISSVKKTISARVEERAEKDVTEEKKKYDKEYMFQTWSISRKEAYNEAKKILGLSEDDAYNMHLDRIKIDNYAGL